VSKTRGCEGQDISNIRNEYGMKIRPAFFEFLHDDGRTAMARLIGAFYATLVANASKNMHCKTIEDLVAASPLMGSTEQQTVCNEPNTPTGTPKARKHNLILFLCTASTQRRLNFIIHTIKFPMNINNI
jgi:hypothetical protein